MISNFDRALKFVLEHEGQYSNNPEDPGGETKWGIARRKHLEISAQDWANFDVTKAAAIYRSQYWDACHCDQLAYPIDICTFDTAVNCGVGAANKLRANSNGPVDFLFNRIEYYVSLKGDAPDGWFQRVVDLYKQFVRK